MKVPATAGTVRGCDQFMKGADVDDYNARAVQRMMARIKIDENGCWIWCGSQRAQRQQNKYGAMWFRGKAQDVHRVSFTLFRGAIPDGLQIDHLCKVTLCANPDHLEAVSQKENIERRPVDGVSRRKIRCTYGHSVEGVPDCADCARIARHRERMRLNNRRWRSLHPGRGARAHDSPEEGTVA